MKREGSFKREARSSRTGMVAAPSKKQDTDSEDQGSSASGSKQSPRKTAPRARGRPRKQPIPPPEEEEDDDEGKDQEEDEEEGRDADEDESRDESKDEEDSAEGEESSEEQTPVSVVLEEIEGEIDEAGETKITKDGQLLGGRQYKCRSFKLPDRGDRIYMLSMDPARVLGFRDSYLFFLRNPQLVRVNTTMEERQWMIENGMLMANFKSKLIAVVTARSIFKSFGARIIKGGRSRVDDYYEANATGEDLLEDSEGDAASRAGDDQMTFGASGGTGVNGAGRSARESSNAPSSFKRRNMQQDEYVRQVTDLNWQYESAMAVRALNARLTELRKESPRFLDPHTNVEQIPILLQPSRCDVVPAAASSDMNASQLPLTLVAGSEPQPSSSSSATAVVSTPRSIGPQVDAAVKINIRPGAPPPPFIHDPEVWAAIPEDIRRALDDAELIARSTEYEDEGDVTRYPISILSGQYQESYPM
ncbi:hypothetical protein EDD11_007603 [Mortierella claussenii]|nr:hypothetical protein EDD11_007603 [Mortierella claussenii]